MVKLTFSQFLNEKPADYYLAQLKFDGQIQKIRESITQLQIQKANIDEQIKKLNIRVKSIQQAKSKE